MYFYHQHLMLLLKLLFKVSLFTVVFMDVLVAQKGQTCWTSEKGHKTVYPYNLNYACGHSKLRTHDETVKHANIAHQKTIKYGKQRSEYGVKGLNWLYAFKGFDIIKSVGIDYMHSILLGVVKKLLQE